MKRLLITLPILITLGACGGQTPLAKQSAPEQQQSDGQLADSMHEAIVLASRSQLADAPIVQPSPSPSPSAQPVSTTAPSTPEPRNTGASTGAPDPATTQPLFAGQMRVICPGYPVGRRGVGFYQQLGVAPVWIPCESGDRSIQESQTIIQVNDPQRIEHVNGVSFLSVVYNGQQGWINMMSLTPISNDWKTWTTGGTQQ